jgi:2-polyprenyl-6-methoxyphenol hydroxylase-like FAD-dependent oxidoreductase
MAMMVSIMNHDWRKYHAARIVGFMKHTHRALIVGGGIAGPAVALFLQRGGIEPLIFEAYSEPATIGGGFQIAPNGMRVMRALGLADQVASAGAPSSEFMFRNSRGRAIGRLDLGRSGFGVTIRRGAFHRILLEETARRGVAVAYGKRLTRIEDRADAVVAHFEDGSAAEGDVLLAADGVHSRVRGLVLPAHARARYTGVIGVGGFSESASVGPFPPGSAQRLTFTLGPRLQFGYATMQCPTPQWGWWSHLPQQPELTREDLQDISDDEMRTRVMEAFRGWAGPIEALVSTTPRVLRTAIYDVPSIPAWHAGRVMLLGDAAHAMSPAGGQGASLALEDAMMVGRGLAEGRAFAEVFADVESRLRVRAERMVRQAAENDARQLKSLGPFGQWMRDGLFPLFAPLIGRELERQYSALEGPAGAA